MARGPTTTFGITTPPRRKMTAEQRQRYYDEIWLRDAELRGLERDNWEPRRGNTRSLLGR